MGDRGWWHLSVGTRKRDKERERETLAKRVLESSPTLTVQTNTAKEFTVL